MKIGVAFYGDVQEVDGQCISTQFFILGGPLIPLKSMFVIEDRGNQKRGFDMNLNGQSTLLGFARIYAFLLGFLFILLGHLLRECRDLLIPGYIIAALWIPLQFFTGKTNPGNARKRRLLGKAVGINAFPEWLPREIASNVYKLLLEKYETLYKSGLVDHPDWKEYMHRQVKLNRAFIHIFYALAAYHSFLYPGSESKQLADKTWKNTAESLVA